MSGVRTALVNWLAGHRPQLNRPLNSLGARTFEAFDLNCLGVFGRNHVLSKFDEGGRIVLDAELLAKAGITEKAKFVGLGDRFQIWEPRAFEAMREQMRALARESLGLLKAKPRRAGQAAAE